MPAEHGNDEDRILDVSSQDPADLVVVPDRARDGEHHLGVISWAIAVDGSWETIGVLLFGGPIALLLAAWPIAVGQALRAIADIGDAVSFDSPAPLTPRPASGS